MPWEGDARAATRAWAAGGIHRSRVARARPPAAGRHRFGWRFWTKNGVSGAASGREQGGTTSSCTSTSYRLPVRAFFGDGLSAATPCFGWVRGSIRCRASIITISFPIRVRRSQLGSQCRVLRYAAAPLAPFLQLENDCYVPFEGILSSPEVMGYDG